MGRQLNINKSEKILEIKNTLQLKTNPQVVEMRQ